MSKRKVYLSWMNSILNEIGQEIEGIPNIQEGKPLCQVIDVLCGDSRLLQTAQETDPCDAAHYLQAVVDHMIKSKVKVTFKVQDILDGDVKSMLDILWLTILNYGIHSIEQPPQERSVGVGKKHLLEWCQKELSTEFDSRNTLTYNLCTTGDWFIQLLRKFVSESDLPEVRNKERELVSLLEVLEKQQGIRQDIVNPTDVIESTIDEHTLMIYISLLKRKVSLGHLDFTEDRVESEKQSSQEVSSSGSPGRRKKASPLVKHSSVDDLADDNSDWFSSSNGSVKSVDPDVTPEGESLIIKTISEQVSEHLPLEGEEDEESVSVLSGSASITTDKKEKLPVQKSETEDTTLKKNTEQKEEETFPKDSAEQDEVLQINVDETFLKEGLEKIIPKIETNVKESLPIVSRTVKRPRTTESIMADARQKFENRKQEWQKMEEARKTLEQQPEGDNFSITSSDLDKSSMKEGDSKSQEEIEDIGAEAGYQGTFGTTPHYYYPGIGRGMPIFIVPGQGSSASPEMQFFLQALRQARHEANFHDQETNRPRDQGPQSLHNLLDLNAVDDVAPNVVPEVDHTKQRETDNEGRGVTFAPSATSASQPDSSVDLTNLPKNKRGILEVVGDGFETNHNILEISKPLRDRKANTGESDGEQRTFPRVDIVEPLKEKIQKDLQVGRNRKKDRKSPERPAVYRPRSLTPGSGLEEETYPKSILKDRSSSRSKSPSLERSSPERAFGRERLTRSVDFSQEMSPRSSLERSPRASIERSPQTSLERSPRSSLERGPVKGDKSPRSPRAKSPAEETQGDVTSPGRHSRETDPNRRLVRVLNRELELLKLKMDVLEKSNLSDDTELEDIDKLTKQLSEQVHEKIAKSPEARSPRISPTRSPRSPRRSSRSPDFTRGRMFRQRKDEDSSPVRSKSETRLHSSASPERYTPDSYTSRSLQDLSITEAPDGNLTFAPTRRGQPISLGYSSPIRKVSEEIWGIDSSDNLGYDPKKVEKWKKLANKSRISDQDLIELKQALATAITENDILQAKLKNSNVEMTEKMEKTNDVLNDCRAHLSRSQAENMELRTQLEKEKTRNESTEERLRETEKQLQAAKSSIDDLEAELEQTRNLLAGSSKKDIPTLQSLTEERDNFKNILANTQRENTELKEDLAREKKLTGKQQSIINDLKNILDDARKERKQLFWELSKFQKQGQLSKVSGIIGKYIENGLYDDDEEEEEEDFEEPINGYSIKSQPNGFAKDSFLTPRRREIPTDVKMTSTPTYRSRSESAGSARRLYDDSFQSSTQKPNSYTSGRSTPISVGRESGYDEMSPPNSARHEIYPHRRAQSYKSNFNSSVGEADDDSVDDLEVQRYFIKRPTGRFDDDKDEQDDFIQRTPKKEMRKSPTLRSNSPSRSRSPKGRSFSEEKTAKRHLVYSPYLMNSSDAVRPQRSYVISPRNTRYDNTKETIECIVESPIDNRYKEEYQRPSRYDLHSPNGDKTFMKALEYAVQQESCNRYYNTDDYGPPYRSSSYGPTRSSYGSSVSPQRNNANIRSILKNAKSETNLSIKEGINSAHRRSYCSQSASPTRSPVRTPTKEIGSHGSSYTYKPYDGSKTCSSPTKPIYSSGLKRSGSLRTAREIFDDELSPVRPVTPIRYQHQPLKTIRFDMEDCVECDVCRDRYNKLRRRNQGTRLKVSQFQTDVCRSCEKKCQI
ncbi:myosin-2 heavy chain-like isoform X2 [Saccostrea cucullata]|uniref:myosin-2 heavy chain-like isoform X2 n=1 Tax=Saccostrea cuccullata TaxID=36930 RepID=UPI002ED11799